MIIDLNIERDKEGFYFASASVPENVFRPNGVGDTLDKCIENVRVCIKDYQEHEGRNDSFWTGVDADKIAFNLVYLPDEENWNEQIKRMNDLGEEDPDL